MIVHYSVCFNMCFFFVFIANVFVSISFKRLYFRFRYINSVSKITTVSVSVNVGSVIISVT